MVRGNWRWLFSVMLAGQLCCIAPQVRAAIIVQTGAPGAPGATGLPGMNGGAGGNAPGVVAVSDNTRDNLAQAIATGGRGGTGGVGGEGAGGIVTNGGQGGPGGFGGNANASATTVTNVQGPLNAISIATGGEGGAGGIGGQTSFAGGDPGDHGIGGRGGNAMSSAETLGYSSGAISGTSYAAATGGNGGMSPLSGFYTPRMIGGAGGDAQSLARSGDDLSQAVSTTSLARGGDGVLGGLGGNAVAEVLGSAPIGHWQGIADAQGGAGGTRAIPGPYSWSLPTLIPGNGGHGGTATAGLLSWPRSSGEATLTLSARGGDGGAGTAAGHTGGNGGQAVVTPISVPVNSINSFDMGTISALQRGGDGGDGYKGASGGNGANSVANSVVAGQATGKLSLQQTTQGGSGGQSDGGRAGAAGNALSVLNLPNYHSYEISARSEAVGGEGGSVVGVGDAAHGGAAASSANAKSYFKAGASTNAYGGNGGSVLPFSDLLIPIPPMTGNAGNGADVLLENAVEAQAPNVFLSQWASGGNGGSAALGRAGRGGQATARLTRSSIDQAVEVGNYAFGGNGGERTAADGTAGAGGDALVETILATTGHSLSAHSSASGGRGGDAQGRTKSGAGGSATAIAKGSSRNTGFSSLGNPINVNAGAYSTGGSAGLTQHPGTTSGIAGAATSLAEGELIGFGWIDVNSTARGGDALYFGWNSQYLLSRQGAAGGAATATARGVAHSSVIDLDQLGFNIFSHAHGGAGSPGVGPTSVGGNGGDAQAVAEGIATQWKDAMTYARVAAEAVGGVGARGGLDQLSGRGGNAEALATGSTSATLEVLAHASGGDSWIPNRSGSAFARSILNKTGFSPGSTAKAAAQVRGGPIARMFADSIAPISNGTGVVESQVTIGQDFQTRPTPTPLAVNTRLMGLPLPVDVATATATNLNSAALLTGADVLALGRTRIDSQGSGAQQTYQSSFQFEIDFTQLASLEDLQLAVMNPRISGGEFLSLQLLVERDKQPVVYETYASFAAAQAALTDRVLNLGDIEQGTIFNTVALSVSFHLTSSGYSSFSADILLANSPLAPMPGDFNSDGVVDSADYTVWRDALDGASIRGMADGNRDGVVNSADRDMWRQHFGERRGDPATSPVNTAVPEPASVVLLGAGLLALGWKRARRARRG